ncbi:MAG: SIR2 family protein [Chloroflexota bacterium]
MAIFFLGAGFSRPAGLPLGDQLFCEIIEEARKRHLYDIQLKYDLDNYRDYYQSRTGVEPKEPIYLEEFVSFLDIQHYLALQGSHTWSRNDSRLIIKNLIAFVLYEHQKEISADKFLLYEKFVERLKPHDWIFTFNYDTVVETALKQKNISYRLYPHRVVKPSPMPLGGGEVDITTQEVVLLKMHGSINWFDKSGYQSFKEEREKYHGLTDNPPNEIFDGRRDNYLHPLVDERDVSRDNPLRSLYVLERLDEYLAESSFLLESPELISPSYNKLVYLDYLREFWYGFMNSGAYEDKIAIIGYSLPPHDEYIRQALYWLIRNYQFFNDPTAGKKSRLRIIDFKNDNEEILRFKQNYRFIDWSEAKTKPYFGGFNEEALDIIFESD